MSSEMPPKYIQQEKEFPQEFKELISSLPREKGWLAPYVYQYQGFWYPVRYLQGIIPCQKHFQAKDGDVFLVTNPKSVTTWFKAILFTLLNRNRYPVHQNDHPLLGHNPHDLVPSLELNIYSDNPISDLASSESSPRLFSTHMPYFSLPETVVSSKIVYLCRNPKDTVVSLWHYSNKLRVKEMGTNSIGEVVDMFCTGVSPIGPYWDHVLGYWKESREDSSRVFFLKYEDMKEQPGFHLRRLAEFSGCGFSGDEEESGLVEEILKLCSFDNLSGLEVNKKGKLSNGMENSAFFRRGEVGDWKNYLSAEMAAKIDQIVEEKFRGSGLVL